MHYPALYDALLDELAAAGQLRSRARRRSYARQLVDLTTGALVRAGNDFPIDDLRAELRSNVDVFWMGAVDMRREPVRPRPGRQANAAPSAPRRTRG